ncbi:hypothetical protein CALCODRAFT_21798 [Calocera cornea HHB12733]|uniref:Uncharacterized protein n=1 Tax=Calocera cornea HHB12733 TaxID=1353952 RepID=A0A165E6C6_9BASI|nr:hypothetical protein CALCODRAFT_21798 [Calocera cornea HHB12733]
MESTAGDGGGTKGKNKSLWADVHGASRCSPVSRYSAPYHPHTYLTRWLDAFTLSSDEVSVRGGEWVKSHNGGEGGRGQNSVWYGGQSDGAYSARALRGQGVASWPTTRPSRAARPRAVPAPSYLGSRRWKTTTVRQAPQRDLDSLYALCP